MSLLREIATWIHVLCAIGSFGALLALEFAVPTELRRQLVIPVARLATFLLAGAFVAGLLTYYGVIATVSATAPPLTGAFHMKVGLKFLCLIGIGALLGMTSARAGRQAETNTTWIRYAAMGLLALAALIAVSLGAG